MVAIISQEERDLARIVFSLRQIAENLNLLGSWTPVLTFAAPGDLSVSYSTQFGSFVKIGRLVIAKFTIITSAFTWSTASGVLTITGLPFASASETSANRGAASFSGITKANYTQFTPFAVINTGTINFDASGSAQPQSTVNAADMPSGGSVQLRGNIPYFAAL
jgi:hypothetical protein